MLVVFISECQKKALNRTRKTLDLFANRVGTYTWITPITFEGLKTIKKELLKSATKNTAVICYNISKRGDFSKIWIIGRKNVFSDEGYMPTNVTSINKIGNADKSTFASMETLYVLLGLSALWHDTGKAWDEFQKEVRGEEANYKLRHDIISLILFATFVNNRDTNVWLQDIYDNNIHIDDNLVSDILEEKKPFEYLSCPLAKTIGWLLLTHHKMPWPNKGDMPSIDSEFEDFIGLDDSFTGYCRKNFGSLSFYEGHVWQHSKKWIQKSQRWAKRGLKLGVSNINANCQNRFLLTLARMCLVIGDWEYSSIEQTQFESGFLWAKSPKNDKQPQYLDEHLIGVQSKSLYVAHNILYFHHNLLTTNRKKVLRKKSPTNFSWQDKAANHINKHYMKDCGLICFNQASTGTGKTFANAKIMNAIQGGFLRYSLVLGLRSLTLQTGKEYKEKIGLSEEEVSVVIGEKIIQELFEKENKQSNFFVEEDYLIDTSWDSEWGPFEQDELLSSVVNNKKARKILHSPVLIATIDHLIGATEDTDRGKFLLPMLRMFSSDLVIDEIDDFDGNDLIAILRLIHIAGMFGRRVVLSSATIPPALAEAAYEAYASGRKLYVQQFEEAKEDVFCLWVDEEMSKSTVLPVLDIEEFQKQQMKFAKRRIENLDKLPVKRSTYIIDNDIENTSELIHSNILSLHSNHCHRYNDVNISFGVVRMANITPVVNLSIGLLSNSLGHENNSIIVMPYHSRLPLIYRHEVEKELDRNLRRQNNTFILSDRVKEIIEREKLKGKDNIIFIVVATPVEEVGRDHDFDWGILEPSSIRSLIQMLGRILRHRNIYPKYPNVAILNKNIRYLVQEKPGPVYCSPGYESKKYQLKEKEFDRIVPFENIKNNLDSRHRIFHDDICHLKYDSSLIDIEHYVLHDKLLKDKDVNLKGWINGNYYLGKFHHKHNLFRGGDHVKDIYIVPKVSYKKGVEYKEYHNKSIKDVDKKIATFNSLNDIYSNLWMKNDFEDVIFEYIEHETGNSFDKNIDIKQWAVYKKYGQISVPFYWLAPEKNEVMIKLMYHPIFGVWKEDPKTLFLRQ